MSEQDELRALGELVAQLTQRVCRLEQAMRYSLLRDPAIQQSSSSASIRNPPATTPESLPTAGVPHAIAEPQTESLERRIGSQWLNRVGVIAVLVGVSYFLKLAFDSGWISAGVRVIVGLVGGTGLCWWSERFRRPASLAFSYSLKAVGIGTLYLSLWASFQLYHQIPGAVAFLGMILVTAATAGVALVQDSELLAGLALLGGVLTPVLCSTGENHEAALFCYLLVLSLGAFFLQRAKEWPRLLFGAFLGTIVLGGAWFNAYYSDEQFSESLLFFSLLFALFAVAPLYARLDRPQIRAAGLLLAIFNAAAYFTAIYSQLETAGNSVQSRASAWAMGLAVVYLALAIALERRVSEHQWAGRTLPGTHYGLAVSFLTIAIPLYLHQQWITLAWLVEGALLFRAGASTARRTVKLFATVVVAIGIFHLLAADLHDWAVQPLILNARLATFAAAIAALLWMIQLERHSANFEAARPAVAAAAVLVNLLALLASGMEIHDYFQLSMGTVPANRFDASQVRHALSIVRNFSYSALIMLYGAVLMWLGFARKSALLRWQAIFLIAATVLKVFLVDVSLLEHGWRVLSFIILGGLLLAVSYAYQRDWLGLQHPRTD